MPTDVEVDDNGSLVVSLLPGGPEDPSPGARGKVVRVDPTTGDTDLVAKGFAGATNVAIGGEDVFVSELFGGVITADRRHGDRHHASTRRKQPAALEWANDQLYVAIEVFNQEKGGQIVIVTPEALPPSTDHPTRALRALARGAGRGSARPPRCGAPGSCRRRCSGTG